ncbi:MAG: 50S ribosomal protein L11 methyltransferase [Magnetococcales bacterium]|nr:50S ribosomal protein L11 methyltransferase [Magnetococcales bacterium]
MIWELRVLVERPWDESVAEWLAEEGSLGVSTTLTGERLLVTGYYEEGTDRNDVEIRLRLVLAAWGVAFEGDALTWRELPDEDWAEAWKVDYQPLKVGRRLWIVPSWLTLPEEDPERLVIRMDPEMAFGSGTHATTRGCLELLESLAGEAPLGRVLDMGSGSGILAIWAALLGAGRVLGTDLDPVAVETARRNVEVNGVAGRVTLIESAEVPEGRFETVVANILASVLLENVSRLVAAVAQGGALILSGILREQAREIQVAFEGEGARLDRTLFIEEWAVLLLRIGLA